MRILRIVLLGALGMVAVLGALLFWFVYTPLPLSPAIVPAFVTVRPIGPVVA